ncbi:hypothetical protein [Pseudoalteromonas sp. S2755]|uniref:hypothetical protein n=1 Tax=Pseudoalteromonas sp. S2755 TaxID=2066523 RepID=UPI0020167E95|nr:hypothetical protein [Pseudoalteromonas sp. S2755]
MIGKNYFIQKAGDCFEVLSLIYEKVEFETIKILAISALNNFKLEKAKATDANGALSTLIDDAFLLEKINSLIQG